MKKLLALVVLLFTTSLLFSQTVAAPLPSNVYGVGVSYSAGASVPVAGTGLYAHLLSQSAGTYAFTVADMLPNSTKPFTVSSNFGAGVAQKVVTIGTVPIYVPTAAGISWSGSNTGWSWSTGAMATIKIKGNWYANPNIRLVKSSVTNGTGYQPTVGILFSWAE